MDFFFNPKNVAVIGASGVKGKVGNTIFQNMLKSFKGKVFPVNPNRKKVLGRKCYPSVKDIKEKVDLAIIAVPSQIVPEVLKDCGEKKVKGAVIISSGFSEIGEVHLEREIKRIAKSHGIRIIGPNCLGILDLYSGVDCIFLPFEKLKRPQKGKISFISQSGAVGSTVLDFFGVKNIGFSKFISYGNAVDLNECDFLEYLLEDKRTSAICLYIEGVRDGKRFLEICKRAKKPIMVVKAGRTSIGTEAVKSHTGSMAGDDHVYDAVFNQAKVLRAKNLQELLDYLKVISFFNPPVGKRVLVITNGGGFGVLTADELVQKGLEIAKLSEKSIEKLKSFLPKYSSISNPLDLAGDATAKRYIDAISVGLDDENVDFLICILLFQTVSLGLEILEFLKKTKFKKPILVCTLGGKFIEKIAFEIEKFGIPVFETPEKVANAAFAISYNFKKL
ncbi:MAG: CoA-binding protein [archaeon]